jgi:hypothetical protein
MLKLVLFVIAVVLQIAPAVARTLIVDGVVSPAWVERGDKREPLTPGMQLNDKDRIVTGGGARVMLRMAEGSAVKLGENTTLAIDNLAEKKNSAGAPVASASLDVVKGAFRFTTGIFSKARGERDVSVKVATVTAGIRGTDVWGRSTSDEDIVCLLEGKISVQHGGKEFAMSEPLSFFIAPRNAPAKPVATVPKQQVDEWSAETEISEGQGATRAGGRVRVELLRTPDQSAAWELANKLKNAGYPAMVETKPGSYGGPGEYFVYIGNVAGTKDRDALLVRIKDVLAGKTDSSSPGSAPKKY